MKLLKVMDEELIEGVTQYEHFPAAAARMFT